MCCVVVIVSHDMEWTTGCYVKSGICSNRNLNLPSEGLPEL